MNTPLTNSARLLVFFDGGCPLCRREISHYRRLGRGGEIQWIDISRPAPELAVAGISPADAMAAFHAYHTGDRRLYSGVPAFIALWQRLPGYRYLAWTATRLHLVGVMQWAYRPFAAWRLRRRCRDRVCIAQ